MSNEKKLMRKVGVIVPADLYDRLSRAFEWGERSRVLTRVLEWMCEKVEKHGKDALILFLREEDINAAVKMGTNLEGAKGGDDK